ncbi:MAG: hypothetical protein ABEI11_03935 [Haloarculaceae archaeon]
MRTRSRGDRGQSSVIGVVLVLGIALIGTTLIVALAGEDITNTQQRAGLQSAEQSLTQFDSEASLVAHGEPTSKQVSVPTGEAGAVRVEPGAGAMTIYAENSSGDVVVDETITLGAVVYEQGSTTIAYQGGGVWRRDGNGSVMVSPPEFDYNVRSGKTPTLTLPLVTVGPSSDSVSGRFSIEQTGDTRAIFPNKTNENPLENGVIEITVQSDYYLAWGDFFENRVEGTVDYDHPNEKVTVKLVVPRSIGVGQGVGTGAATLTLENGGFINSYDSREAPYSSPGEANAIVAIDGNVSTTNSATVRGTVRATGDADINNNINVSGPFVAAGSSDVAASPEFSDVYSTGGDLLVDASKAQFRDDVIVGGDVIGIKNNNNAGINGTLYAGGSVTLNSTIVETDVIAGGDVLVKDDNNNEVRGMILADGSVTIVDRAAVHDINATGRVVIDGATVDGDVRTTEEIEMVNGATITGTAVAGNDTDNNGLAIEMGTNSEIQGDAFGEDVDDEDGTVDGTVEEDSADIPSPAATVVTPSAPLNPGVSIPDDVNDIITNQDSLIDDANNDNDQEDNIDESSDTFDNGPPYTIEAGSYFLDSPSLVGDSITFDTSGGDIAIYVDGTFNVDGADIDVTGDGKVKLYMDDDLDWVGDTDMSTTGGAGNQFYVFMRPNGTADFDNQATFKGALYGPRNASEDGTDVTINNNVEIFGGIIGNVEATSNNNEIHYDEALNEELLIGGAGVPRVTFLHISTTEIKLED